jgi:hypothetical protein
MKWRVQVYERSRPFRAWLIHGCGLEQAKQEAERAVARDWPLKEFSIAPAR